MSRVEAVIEKVMAEHKGEGPKTMAAYYEAVHQELAPLAREFEIALRSVVAHWREFGPEHGMDECIEMAARVLTHNVSSTPPDAPNINQNPDG